MSAFGMELQSLLSLVGGTAGLLCLIYFLLSKKRKVRLEGKVVLVTGANSGLGKACAEEFCKRGCKVILAGRDLSKIQSVQKELRQKYSEKSGNLAVLKVDLGDLDTLKVKGEEAKALFGKIDILINNAGVSYRGSIEDTDIDVHKNVMTVNYFGQIALTKVFMDVGVDLDKPVVTHCNSGMSSCSVALAAIFAGATQASVYVGGFNEWKRKNPEVSA